LVHAQESGGVEVSPVSVKRGQIVLHCLIAVAFLLVDEAQVVVDRAGTMFHLGGALQLRKRGIILAVKIESGAEPAVHKEGQRVKLKRAAHVRDGILRTSDGVEKDGEIGRASCRE